MTAERDQPETDRSQANPENIIHLKDELLSLWEQLPSEHRATMALVLFDEIQQSEWGAWLKEAIELKWGKEQQKTEQAYPVISLSRNALHQIFTQEEVAQFSDNEIQLIAEGIGAGLNLNPSFWNVVETTGRSLLESHDLISKRPLEIYQAVSDRDSEDEGTDFSQWMEAVDQSVWMIAGCSVHDLPDCNFRSMFDDGATPAEMANEALKEAGFVS